MESIKNINEILHYVFNTESLKPMCILHTQHISAQTSHISHAQLPLRPSGSHIWLHSCKLRALGRQNFLSFSVPEGNFFSFSVFVVLLYISGCLVTTIIFKEVFIKLLLTRFFSCLFSVFHYGIVFFECRLVICARLCWVCNLPLLRMTSLTESIYILI